LCRKIDVVKSLEKIDVQEREGRARVRSPCGSLICLSRQQVIIELMAINFACRPSVLHLSPRQWLSQQRFVARTVSGSRVEQHERAASHAALAICIRSVDWGKLSSIRTL